MRQHEVFSSILVQIAHGASVKYAVSISITSRQNMSAFCSAWSAWHRSNPVPRSAHRPGHGFSSEQCAWPRAAPLYPVASVRPYWSTRTHPTWRRGHVPRVATSAAMLTKYWSMLGRTRFIPQCLD